MYFQLSKRIRESCRNLKAKQGKTKHFNPEDYTSFQLPNVSFQNNSFSINHEIKFCNINVRLVSVKTFFKAERWAVT